MKKSAEWKTVDILLEEINGLLYVNQRGKKYIARNWKLTDELCGIVHLAVSKGLGCVWRERGKKSPQGHPKESYFEGGEYFEKGSHHIGFSRTPQERWVFVVGDEAGPPEIKKITFEKHYAEFLDAAKIHYEKEKGRGKNLSVDPKNLKEALDYLIKNVALDVVEERLRNS